MRTKWWFLGIFTYFHAMLYAKMFHGYDILKHEFIVNLTDFTIRIRASCSNLQVSPSFFSQKIINIADSCSILAIVCSIFYTFVFGI